MQTGEEVTDIFKAVGFNFPGLYRLVLGFFFASRWWHRVADSLPADPQTAVRPRGPRPLLGGVKST